jgi:hypothetical protein
MENSEQEPSAAPGYAGAPEGKSDLGRWFDRRSQGQRVALAVVVLVVVAAIAVPLALSGGGRTRRTTYPANVRANFLRACAARASNSQCTCALAQIESQVPLHQFVQDELTYETTGKLPSYYQSVVFSCLAK